ncbi:hypothetical protein [Clostridium sp.]|uniref:hypothetical protein n=1 Tax=Clostridium sp. TaxID=1506 RepID=UPI003216889A
MNALNRIRKENNTAEKQLSDDNNVVLTDMVVYLHSSNLNEYDIEAIRKDLIGMALESQLRLEDFKESIGEDYKSFCDKLIKNGRKKTKYEIILENLFIFIVGAGILFILEILSSSVINDIFTKKSLHISINIGFILSTLGALVGAYGIYWYVTSKSFELTGKESLKNNMGFIIVYIIVFVAMIFCKVKLKDNVLFTVNVLYPLVFFIGGFLIVNTLNNKNINGYAKEIRGKTMN